MRALAGWAAKPWENRNVKGKLGKDDTRLRKTLSKFKTGIDEGNLDQQNQAVEELPENVQANLLSFFKGDQGGGDTAVSTKTPDSRKRRSGMYQSYIIPCRNRNIYIQKTDSIYFAIPLAALRHRGKPTPSRQKTAENENTSRRCVHRIKTV